jgi:hypothetical protein
MSFLDRYDLAKHFAVTICSQTQPQDPRSAFFGWICDAAMPTDHAVLRIARQPQAIFVNHL